MPTPIPKWNPRLSPAYRGGLPAPPVLRAVGGRSACAAVPADLEEIVYRGTELVRRRTRKPSDETVATGIQALDRVLEGGVTRGAVTELVGSRSCGRMAAILATLAGMTAGGEIAALVDLGNHLDVEAAQRAGVNLQRLLWLRPRRLPEAMELTEMLLQTGLALVVADLGLPPVRGRVSTGAWMRIVRAAEVHGGAVLISAPYHISGHTPQTVVRLAGGRGAWSGKRRGAPLLEALNLSCTVVRRRGGRPGAHARGSLPVATPTTSPRHLLAGQAGAP